MEITTVRIERPEAVSVILGQSHFIKTVEDVHEAMVNSVPGIKFGVAFCEASGDRLVRGSGTDEELVELAARNALAVGAGHSFVLLLGDGVFPINVLNALRAVPEVCTIFCATANPVEAIVVEAEAGRGIAGVIDGAPPLGVEDEEHEAARKDLLRSFGYKL
jgi:adenosine/AMP kinase